MKSKRQLKYSRILSALILLLAITGCQKNKIEPKDLVPPTVIDDLSLPSLVVNGTTLHLQTFGNPANPPIFFLHGGPGVDAKELLSFTRTDNDYNFTDDYYLIIWDQRGTGLSQRHNETDLLSKDVYAQDLEAVINHFVEPDSQIVFLAHSFGGLFAANYMNTHPQKVAGAILMEPVALSTNLMDELEAPGGGLGSEWTNDYLWARQFVSMSDHDKADYEISIGYTGLENSERDSEPYPMNRLGAAALYYVKKDIIDTDYDFTVNLNQLSSEVLFIVGSETETYNQAFQEKQRLVFPNTSLKVIPGAGHDDIVWSKVSESKVHIKNYLATLNW